MQTGGSTNSRLQINPVSRAKRILAIDPGTEFVGFAQFEGDKLIDFGVISIGNAPPIRDLLVVHGELMERILSEKRPDLVVLEKNAFSQISQNLRLVLVIGQMKAAVRDRGIRVRELAPRTIRSLVANDGKSVSGNLCKRPVHVV